MAKIPMTGPSHYVGGVELAIAELQEPLGVNDDRPPLVISLEGVRTLCAFNARSDKTSLSGSFEPQQEFAPVRMLARRVDLTATCVAAAVAITDRAVPDTLRCGAVSSRTPNRRHIAKPTPTSVHPGGTGSGVVIRNDDYSCCGFDAGSMPIGRTNTDFSTPKAIDHQQIRWKGIISKSAGRALPDGRTTD